MDPVVLFSFGTALIRLITILIEKAERRKELTGPEKKQYVMEALEPLYEKLRKNHPEAPEWLEAKLMAADVIDISVLLINKNLRKK